jgi:hypothetical protein
MFVYMIYNYYYEKRIKMEESI